MENSSQLGRRARWLLCLMLFMGTVFGVPAVAEEVQGRGPAVEQSRIPEKVAVKAGSAKPGLAKILTTKYPRRADIPDAFLVIMLALIGVVVISRRGVTEKEGGRPPHRNGLTSNKR